MTHRRNRINPRLRKETGRQRIKTPLQMNTLKIGELSKKSGIPIVTLRFYEIEGLIQPVRTAEAKLTNHRRFDPATVGELEFLKSARAAGFSIPEAKSIIKLYRGFQLPAKPKLAALRRTIELIRQRKQRLDVIEKIFVKRLRDPEAPAEEIF
jgi:DNA-binding transcriptional MerR regulator